MADVDGLDRLPKWWPVITAIVIIIAMFVRVQTGAEASDNKIANLEKRVTAAERSITDIRVMVGEIKVSAASMEKSVDRIEDAVNGR